MYRLFLYFFLIILVIFGKAYGIENKILFKIDNKIITSIDISNEINYLTSLNKNILELENEKIFEIAKNSLIKEKMKEIELLKVVKEIDINETDFNNLILPLYIKNGINSIDELKQYFILNTIDIKVVKRKIAINAIWNQMIYQKFSQNLNINREEIRKDLLQNDKQKEFLLSEILFELKENEKVSEKFELIKNTINEKGFIDAALIYSISDTSKTGGELGWVKEKSINPKIMKKVLSLNEGEFSNPITLPGGFLILKVNQIRESSIELDIENEIEKVVKGKINAQLNQFSNIYLNKIRKDIVINEL